MIFPKVSVLIPTFNRFEYLEQAIDSALDQSYANIEIIVSDNASTDITGEMLNKYADNVKIKLFRNQNNIGMVNNWRKMLYEYATGEWFVILSDDDYFIDKDYLKDAISLTRNGAVKLVYSSGYIRNESTGQMECLRISDRRIYQDGQRLALTLNENSPQPFMLCNVLFNTDLAIRLDAFKNEYNIGCDTELFLISVLNGNVGFIDRQVSVYRQHGSNLIGQNIKDFKLFYNNVDCVLKPYEFIKNNGFSKDYIKSYEEKVLMPFLRSKILEVAIYFNGTRSEFLKYLKKLVGGQVMRKIFYNGFFLLKYYMYKNAPYIYKFLKKVR